MEIRFCFRDTPKRKPVSVSKTIQNGNSFPFPRHSKIEFRFCFRDTLKWKPVSVSRLHYSINPNRVNTVQIEIQLLENSRNISPSGQTDVRKQRQLITFSANEFEKNWQHHCVGRIILHQNRTWHLSIRPSYESKFCHNPQPFIITLCPFFFPSFSKSQISIWTENFSVCRIDSVRRTDFSIW